MSNPASAITSTSTLANAGASVPPPSTYLMHTLPIQIMQKRQRSAPRPHSPLRNQVDGSSLERDPDQATADDCDGPVANEAKERAEMEKKKEQQKKNEEEQEKDAFDVEHIHNTSSSAPRFPTGDNLPPTIPHPLSNSNVRPTPAQKPNPFAAYDPTCFADLGIEDIYIDFERVIGTTITGPNIPTSPSNTSTAPQRVEAPPHHTHPPHPHPQAPTLDPASVSALMPIAHPSLPLHQQRGGFTSGSPGPGPSGFGFGLVSSSLPRPPLTRANASSDVSLVSIARAHAQGTVEEEVGTGGHVDGITASTSVGLGLMQPATETQIIGAGAAASSVGNDDDNNNVGGRLALMTLASSSSVSRLSAPMVPPRFSAGIGSAGASLNSSGRPVNPVSPCEPPVQALCAPTAVFPDNDLVVLSPSSSPLVHVGRPAPPSTPTPISAQDVNVKEKNQEENEVYEGKRLLKSAGAIEHWRHAIIDADTDMGFDVGYSHDDPTPDFPRLYTLLGPPARLISALRGLMGIASHEQDRDVEANEDEDQDQYREQQPLAVERRDDACTVNAGRRAEPVARRGVARAVSVSVPTLASAGAAVSRPSAPLYSGAHAHKFTPLDTGLVCGAKRPRVVEAEGVDGPSTGPHVSMSAAPASVPIVDSRSQSSVRAKKSREGLGLGLPSALASAVVAARSTSSTDAPMMSTAEECTDIALLARGGDIMAAEIDPDLGSPVMMHSEVRLNTRVFHPVPRFAARVLYCISEEDSEDLELFDFDEEEALAALDRAWPAPAARSPLFSGLGMALVGAWSGTWARIASLVVVSPVLPASPAGSSEYHADGEREEHIGWGMDDAAYDADSVLSVSLVFSDKDSAVGENTAISPAGSLPEAIGVSAGAAVEASSTSSATSVTASGSGSGTVDPSPSRRYTIKLLSRLSLSRSSSSRTGDGAVHAHGAASPGLIEHTDAPRGLGLNRFGAAVRRFQGLF